MKTVLAIDQSTSGTKALLFDGEGRLLGRQDLPHEQKVSSMRWVSHDPPGDLPQHPGNRPPAAEGDRR